MKTMLCYIKDEAGRYLSANEAFLNSIQAVAFKDIAGRTDKDIPWGSPASCIMDNDKRVLASGEMTVVFETCWYHGNKQLFRSIKIPLKDSANGNTVIHGISMPVSNACHVMLSHQQSVCLQHFAHGFTHKQIGELLSISQKTVEHYLEAVKLKLGCKGRADLVRHAIERGLVGAIF